MRLASERSTVEAGTVIYEGVAAPHRGLVGHGAAVARAGEHGEVRDVGALERRTA